MISILRKTGGYAALAASLSMMVPPVAAAELPADARTSAGLPIPDMSWPDMSWSSDVDTVQDRGGWGGRWGGYRGYRHRDRVDAGDVIAGILILGTIAAVADAASKSNNRSRDRDDDYRQDSRRRDDNPRYGGWESDDRYDAGQAGTIDRAAQLCLDEARNEAARRDNSRNAPQGRIDGVTAEGNGWRVNGAVGGYSFTCGTTDGRIDYVRVGDGSAQTDDAAGADYSFAQ